MSPKSIGFQVVNSPVCRRILDIVWAMPLPIARPVLYYTANPLYSARSPVAPFYRSGKTQSSAVQSIVSRESHVHIPPALVTVSAGHAPRSRPGCRLQRHAGKYDGPAISPHVDELAFGAGNPLYAVRPGSFPITLEGGMPMPPCRNKRTILHRRTDCTLSRAAL